MSPILIRKNENSLPDHVSCGQCDGDQPGRRQPDDADDGSGVSGSTC